MIRPVSFTLNGASSSVRVDDERMLLWVLRYDLGLRGTRSGCGAGLCGAYTVLVDNEAMRSGSTAAKDVAGKQVLTIEGLSRNGALHPLRQAFLEHNAFQCGFCTSEMILSPMSSAPIGVQLAGLSTNGQPTAKAGGHRSVDLERGRAVSVALIACRSENPMCLQDKPFSTGSLRLHRGEEKRVLPAGRRSAPNQGSGA